MVVESDPGLYDAPARAEHRLMIHLGAPARVRCAYDDVGQDRLQSRGDIDIIPAGFQAMWEDDDPTSTMSIWFHPSLLKTAARGKTRRPSLLPRLQERDAHLFRLALILKEEAESADPADTLFIDAIGLALGARLLQMSGEPRPRAVTPKLSRRDQRRVLDHIDENLDGDVSIGALAEVVDLSQSYFRELFGQTFGRSVHRYVTEKRVERARALLESGRFSISQAALESGFSHQGHLARRMRQVLGVVPSEFLRGGALQPG